MVTEENDGRPKAARSGEDKDVPREMGPPVDDNAWAVVVVLLVLVNLLFGVNVSGLSP